MTNLENPLKGYQSGSPTPTAEPTVSDGGAGSPGLGAKDITIPISELVKLIKALDSAADAIEAEVFAFGYGSRNTPRGRALFEARKAAAEYRHKYLGNLL